MKLKYSFENYFKDHKFMAYFYNALIKDNINTTKSDFLLSLDISPATYNRTVKNETRSSKIVFSKLENYFNINPLDINRIKFYDKVLTDVLIAIFYKSIDIKTLKTKIQLCIDDNNYLSPIFDLFLCLVNLLNVDLLEIFNNEFKIIYNNLKKYKDLFNVYPINELFKFLYISTGTKDIYKQLHKFNTNNEFSGLIYNAIAINAYHNNKYDISLHYANKSYSELQSKCNFNKLLTLNLTKFADLNAMSLFSETIQEATSQFIYLNLVNKNPLLLKITKLHLYNALIGINDFNTIHDIIMSLHYLDTIDHTYLLISSFYLNKDEYNKLKINIYSYIEEKHKKYIETLINFFESNNIEEKIKIINNSNLNKTLIRLLLNTQLKKDLID